MKYRVQIEDAAEDDLRDMFTYIAEESDEVTALRYIRRILAWCRSLETFPMRGYPREDLVKGLRIAGFERRVSIAFVVGENRVNILRILYGGRDVSVIDFPGKD